MKTRAETRRKGLDVQKMTAGDKRWKPKRFEEAEEPGSAEVFVTLGGDVEIHIGSCDASRIIRYV